MNIIKLNAIDSTNSYLKELAINNEISSYTVVVAKHQTAGRGQMGTVWLSEDDKNLTFSILIKISNFKVSHQFYLSMAVSLGVLKAVKTKVTMPMFIKWPNDILAEKDKVAGILIENMLSGTAIKQSIIGIGLNVNQKQFSVTLKNVTSLMNITGETIDKEQLLETIVNNIQYYVEFIEQNEFYKLKELYLNSLYKYKIPSMFEENNGAIFLGKIIDISKEGKLVIELENETIRKFNLKEIKFANR